MVTRRSAGFILIGVAALSACATSRKEDDHLSRHPAEVHLTDDCRWSGGSVISPVEAGACFAAGTKVDAPKGPVSIEEIHLGDQVYSYNENSRKIEIGVVTGTDSHIRRQTCAVTLSNGISLKVTPEHPFYYPRSQTWAPIAARENNVLSSIQSLRDDSSPNSEIYIQSISGPKSSNDKVDVYNIEVQSNHNFFVNGVLVHNKNGG